MTNKYELREGEKYIDEYIDGDGTHVTILKDRHGQIKHGWNMEVEADFVVRMEAAATIYGMDVQDYIDEMIERAIMALIEEDKKRQAIEDISD